MDDERQPLLNISTGSSRASSLTSTPDSSLVPAEPPRWKTNFSFILVLVTETLERLAFYGLICNLVPALNSFPLLWTSYDAVGAIFIMNGISYIMTLFGGWIADSFLGKYRTIVIFFLVYIGGFAIWPFLFYPPKRNSDCSNNGTIHTWCMSPGNNTTVQARSADLADENCSWTVFLSLTIVAIGYGAVRVNIIPFGALQVEHEGRNATRVYFNWLYWCINIGSLAAYTILGFVQQQESYFFGYLAPLLALGLAYVVFLSGSCVYTKKYDATGSVISNIFCVIKDAVTNCLHQRRRRESRDAAVLNSDMEVLTRQQSANVLCCLDYAKLNHGGSYQESLVEDTKSLGKIFLVFMSMIPYWTVYYQMQTTFLLQGTHMKLKFHYSNETDAEEKDFKIPVSWLSLFDIIFVIIFVPLLDRVIYPALDKAGRSPSLRLRVMFGMFFTLAAMVVAGVLEDYRLHTYWGTDNKGHPKIQYIACSKYYAADLMIFWQIPQYVLMGVSEVFTCIAGLEMAFICSPRSFQAIIMGLFYLSQGIGSFLGTAIIMSFQGTWFSPYDFGNINCKYSPFTNPDKEKCHMDYYFYFLAGFQFLGILLFVFIAWKLDVGRCVPLRCQERGITVVRPSTNAHARAVEPHVGSSRAALVHRRNMDFLS